MKTKPGDISLYTCVPQMTIIKCMFSKIWDLMNRILLSSWTIFCHSPPPPHYFLSFHSQDNTDQNGGWYLSWVPNLGLSPKYDNTTMLLFRNKEL